MTSTFGAVASFFYWNRAGNNASDLNQHRCVVKGRSTLNIFRFHWLCGRPVCQQASERFALLVSPRSSLLQKIKYTRLK